MSTEPRVRENERGALLPVRVHPGARRSAVTGVHDGAVKVSLQAPPVDGRANGALVEFLAAHLGVARSAVTITAGETSRNKVVLIAGKTAVEVQALLASGKNGQSG